MALEIINQTLTGHYGESLNSTYVRVEPQLDKTGTKIVYELYFHKDKASWQAGAKTIKANEKYTVDYAVTNDPYILYGLHALLASHLDSEGVYASTDVSIVDVDVPPA